MATQVETSGGGMDAVKWVVAILILTAATLGNHYAEGISPIVRIAAVVILAFIALAVALTTAKGRNFLSLLREARVEARKIVWPSRQETWQTTLIVASVVILTSLLLWGIDSFFGWIISAIIGN